MLFVSPRFTFLCHGDGLTLHLLGFGSSREGLHDFFFKVLTANFSLANLCINLIPLPGKQRKHCLVSPWEILPGILRVCNKELIRRGFSMSAMSCFLDCWGKFQPLYYSAARSDLCDAAVKQEWPVQNRAQKKQNSLFQLALSFGELRALIPGSERQDIKRKLLLFCFSTPTKLW